MVAVETDPNRWGVHGNGTVDPEDPTFGNTPKEVPGLNDVVRFDASGRTACAIRANHELWCWGLNDRGGVGDGTLEDRHVPVRVVWDLGE